MHHLYGTLIAFMRTLKSEAQSFEHYAKELETIRYRDSKRGTYTNDFTILVNGFTIMLKRFS